MTGPGAHGDPVFIGLDLGGTKVYGVVLRGDEVVAEAKRKTPLEGGPAAIVDTLVAVVGDLGGTDGIAAVGVGAPGAIDAAAGSVRNAPNLPGFADEVPLGPMLASALGGLPVRLDNDVSVAVRAEHQLGAGREQPNLLGVWVGTGVGGGLVLDDRPRRGPTGVAGEIGHTVVSVGDRRCSCGRRGHLEAYAGRAGMEAEARRRAEETGHENALVRLAPTSRMTSRIFAKALAEKDAVAEELLDQAVHALGDAVASAATILDVPLVVVGGGLADKLGARFTNRVDHAAHKRLFPAVRALSVVPSHYGDRAGAVGAALLAREA